MDAKPELSHKNKMRKSREELKRLHSEYKELHIMLDLMNSSYRNLEEHVMKLRKEMQEENIGFSSHESVQIDSVSLISVRTEHHTDSSLDGYKWRKNGQKITKGNSSLRTYFKCAMAPMCQVKKKVQRSAEDKSVVVAIYEGEHNHPIHSNCKESIQNHLDVNSLSANVDLELGL